MRSSLSFFRKNIFRLLIVSGIILSLSSCEEKASQIVTSLSIQDSLVIPVETMYGIPIDSFDIIEGKVRRNQFLADILTKQGVEYPKIQSIVDNYSDTFDFRKVKRGNKYLFFTEKDSLQSVRYFVYIDNAIDYYVFDLGEQVSVNHNMKEVVSDLKICSGTIQTSLWVSMQDQGINPELSNELSDIFAWSIDFFGLQKGDSYKVIYDEEFVDSTSVGIKKIFGAFFRHANEDFYAIPLIQDGKEDFYDQEGNSLRKAFLKAPLKFSRISSRFSNSRLHPVLKIRRPHHGIDYAAPVGTPVQSIGDGKVIEAQHRGANGKIVKVKHNSIYTTAYLHLSRFGPGIRAGKYVKQGDIIGYVGSTGLSTGPHLDFRFYKSGHPVNPLKVKAPPVKPVSDDNRAEFDKISHVMISLLDNIEYCKY
ncbi:MAG: peptidoglycan DD-metalloendopeptidase family protein [Bacteroidales bacterium]|nr:peptidoglycan DD-metalloendopeptidase family protein [Bacteroidales bacterium]